MFIGKSTKGTVVHAILGSELEALGGHAACDKRQKGLIPDDSLDASAITCSRCLQRAEVKKALDLLEVKKELEAEKKKEPPAEKTDALPELPKKKKKRGKKGKAAEKKAEKKPAEKKQTETMPEEEQEPVNDVVVIGKDDIAEDGGDFFARIKKDDRFKIFHLPTGKVFFDSIPEEVVLDAITKLNEIEDQWESTKVAIPKDFVLHCRKALQEAYSENNKTIPKNLLDLPEEKKKKKSKAKPEAKDFSFKKGDTTKAMVDGREVDLVFNGKTFVMPQPAEDEASDHEGVEVEKKRGRKIKRRAAEEETEEEKPRRVIKRREVKKPKRVIKRRKNTFLGAREGTPGYTILKMIEDGASMKELVLVLYEKHDLVSKKAWTKVRKAIRKVARKRGIPVTITMGKSPGDDYFCFEHVTITLKKEEEE